MIQIRTGLDMVEIPRFSKTIERLGEAFIDRVFLPAESAYCGSMADPAAHYAARFAAKEAVAKAFGTGIGKELGWLDIEIGREIGGCPVMQLHGKGQELAKRMGVLQVEVSLTHTSDHAAAHVVLLLDASVNPPRGLS